MSDQGVKIEGGYVVIRLTPLNRKKLRAELEPCPCKTNKSAATQRVREDFLRAMDDPPIRLNLHEVHGIRVMLGDCPCRAPTPKGLIRQRLSQAMGKVRA